MSAAKDYFDDCHLSVLIEEDYRGRLYEYALALAPKAMSETELQSRVNEALRERVDKLEATVAKLQARQSAVIDELEAKVDDMCSKMEETLLGSVTDSLSKFESMQQRLVDFVCTQDPMFTEDVMTFSRGSVSGSWSYSGPRDAVTVTASRKCILKGIGILVPPGGCHVTLYIYRGSNASGMLYICMQSHLMNELMQVSENCDTCGACTLVEFGCYFLLLYLRFVMLYTLDY